MSYGEYRSSLTLKVREKQASKIFTLARARVDGVIGGEKSLVAK